MADIAGSVVGQGWLFTSVIGLMAALIVLMTGLRGSDWSPLLVMASVPVQREAMIGRGSAEITLTQAVVGAFLFAAVVRFAAGTLRIRVDAILVAFGTLMGLYCLSVLEADAIVPWAAESYRWGVSALFLIFARPYFSCRSRNRVLFVLAAMAVGIAALAAVQVVREAGPTSFSRSGWTRAFGTFGEPNAFATFIRSVTLPVLALAMISRSGWSRLRTAMLIAALAGLSGVALTQSRGGILGLAAGLAVIGFVVLTRRNKVFLTAALPAIAVIAALMIVVAAAAQPWEVFKSPTTPSNWANQERASHWSAGFDMINESPLFGVGAGGFGDRYRISTNHWRFRISQGHAHNAYLQVAAEAGLGAMVAYLSLIAAIVGSVIRRARSSSDPWFEIGVLAVTFALLTHQLVDYLHALSLGLLFAGLWAAALESGSRGPTVRERDTVA